MNMQPDTHLRELAAYRLKAEKLERENAALREALKKSNSQAEHFEREWYLRGDALEAFAGTTASPPSKEYVELPKPPHWGAMHTGRGGKVEMYPQQYREALDRAFTVGVTHALRTGGKP